MPPIRPDPIPIGTKKFQARPMALITFGYSCNITVDQWTDAAYFDVEQPTLTNQPTPQCDEKNINATLKDKGISEWFPR
ncbi:hypothetical protein TcasGA2_TC007216 [Tribolium castaneum]|uniref:Uncharacterized protein n=1 Tax=Tribolium castaneum TaxID=7070 RepID=D2A0R9_TRICA|nr:hypothetical protein TcasGA2_TC007216 [Tribolium castaneum]